VARSRDGVLRHEWRPADAVHSPDAKRSLAEAMLLDAERFLAGAHFHSEKRSPPAGACSRDAALLPEWPADAVHFQAWALLPGWSLDAAYWPSPKRSVDEAHHCALLGCCAPPCQVE